MVVAGIASVTGLIVAVLFLSPGELEEKQNLHFDDGQPQPNEAVALPTAPQNDLWVPDDDGNLHHLDLEKQEEPMSDILAIRRVDFLLYTKSNPTNAQSIHIENNQVGSNFNPKNPTRFVTHGWVSSAKTVDDIRAGYIADPSSDYNIIMVDWKALALTDYVTAKAYTRTVGSYLANVVNYLRQNNSLNIKDVSLVGHSLGAHVVGVAGHHLNGQVGSIVGLDPALPLFLDESHENRLDSNDARYVQVIHTDGGALGFDGDRGHIDFFPNNGRAIQPGCVPILRNACSHLRSVKYFAESIATPTGFNSRKCPNWDDYNRGLCNKTEQTVMGEKVDKRMRGNFYLSTNQKSPFAQG